MPFNKKTPTIIPGKMQAINLSNYKVEGLHVFVDYKKEKYRVLVCDLNEVILMKQGKRRTYNYILR